MTARLELTETVDDAVADELWPLYAAVFDDQPDRETWQREVWDRHVVRPGFRLARSWQDDRLVGFGYGYTGERGQWWTDQAATVLDPSVAHAWLGGHFELVSIGVAEDARGQGLGRELLGVLTSGLPHERLLLMATADEDDPARRLYADDGWIVVGPGLAPDQVILGKRR